MKQIQPRQSPPIGALLDDLKALIDQARWQVAAAVNAALTLLYWQVGQRIRTDLLLEKDRAAYGEQILATLSQQLTRRYGPRVGQPLSASFCPEKLFRRFRKMANGLRFGITTGCGRATKRDGR